MAKGKRHSFCLWCHKKVELPAEYQRGVHRPFCSMHCMTTNMLFEQYYVPLRVEVYDAEKRWKGPKKGGRNARKS